MNRVKNLLKRAWSLAFRYETAGCLVVLCLINVLLFWINPLAKVDPDSLPSARTYVWWATRDFRKLTQRPDVVLLGASSMMYPVTMRDSDYLKRDVDYALHHRSIYLEKLLADKLGMTNPLCFTFALPGSMASDDYMVERALLTGAMKPNVIVIGITPRDFMDNSLHCAGGTPIFRYLQRFTPIDDLVRLAMPKPWQRADYLASKTFYLWAKRLDLQVMLAEYAKSHVPTMKGGIFAPSVLTLADPVRNMPANLRDEVEPGMMMAYPGDPIKYQDNTDQMKRRYRTRNLETLATQCTFFEMLISLAKQRNIKVAIVNLPITPENHALLPPQSYSDYIGKIREQAQKWHCSFIDLDAGGNYEAADFCDTIHMNGRGGKKLVDTIAELLCGKEELASALTGEYKHTASTGGAY